MCLAGQGHSERHEQIRPLSPRAFLQDFGQLFEVRGGLAECIGGGCEKSRPRRCDDVLLVMSQGRQVAAHHCPPRSGIGGQDDIMTNQLDELGGIARPQPGRDLRG